MLYAEQRLAEMGEALLLWLSADGAARQRAAALSVRSRQEHAAAENHFEPHLQAVLTTVGHDLRNPLGVIAMSAALLRDKGGLAGWQAQTVERICSASTQMQRLLDEMKSRGAERASP